MEITVAALEGKRLADGLSDARAAQELGITSAAYRALRANPHRQMRLTTCGAVSRCLAVNPEEVLCWEGYWGKLSMLGRVMAPAMLTSRVSIRALAGASDTDESTVHRALWDGRLPPTPILKRWEEVLHLNNAELRRAARRAAELRPKRPLESSGLGRQIERTVRREGRGALRKRGDQLQRATYGSRDDELTDEQRRERRERRQQIARKYAVPAQREFWQMATPAERHRFGLAQIRPRPKGRFGICRFCAGLTYQGAKRTKPGEETNTLELSNRPALDTVEYHRTCYQQHDGTTPLPSHSAGRRPNSKDLARYWEMAVLLLRIRRRLWGAGRPPKWQPESVTELAKAFDLTVDGLLACIERFLRLLPDPAVCDRNMAVKVRAMRALATQNGVGEGPTAGGTTGQNSRAGAGANSVG